MSGFDLCECRVRQSRLIGAGCGWSALCLVKWRDLTHVVHNEEQECRESIGEGVLLILRTDFRNVTFEMFQGCGKLTFCTH